jgi:hypothetical protein
MKYPRILRDEETGCWFIADAGGPRSWHYHRAWWRALLEPLTGI